MMLDWKPILNKDDGKLPGVVQATLDVFLSAVAVEDSYNGLLTTVSCGTDGSGDEGLLRLAEQFLAAGDNEALWCLMLSQFSPPAEVTVLIEIVRGAFATSVVVPTGLRLRDSTGRYGNSHIVREKMQECVRSSKVAMRVLLVAVGRWLQSHHHVYNPQDDARRGVFLQLCRQQLALEDDTITVTIAAKAISHGIPVDIFSPGPSELLAQNLAFAEYFISPFFNQLSISLNRFLADKRRCLEKHEELLLLEEGRRDADFAYQGVLYEVAAVDVESDLPVPLSHYLKDSETLKEAYDKKNKAYEALVAGGIALQKGNESVQLLTSCCRLLLVMCSVMMHTLVVERGRIPTTQQGDAVEIFATFDWRPVLAFGRWERRVSNCILSRLFMACAARSFPSLQDIFTSDGVISSENSDEEDVIVPCPARLALTDLCSPHLVWFSTTERNDSKEEALQPLEEVLLRRQIHLPTLDTRISTSLCHWAVVFNPQAQRRFLSWLGSAGAGPLWRELVLKSKRNREEADKKRNDEVEEDRSAPLINFLRAAPTPSEPDNCQIVQDVGACSYFADFYATAMADAFLTFSSLEGASPLPHRRGLHPLDVVSLVVAQAPPETLCAASLDEHRLELCSLLFEVVKAEQEKPLLIRNELTLHSGLVFYSQLRLGRSSFLCPSAGLSGKAEHGGPDRPRQLLLHPLLREGEVVIRPLAACIRRTAALYLSTMSCDLIYSGLVSNVLPLSLREHCLFSTALQVLTCLTLDGQSDIVLRALGSASTASRTRWNLAEQFGKDDDADNPFIMPFLLAVEGGSVALLRYYVEAGRIKGALENQALVAAVTGASSLVKHHALVLLSCLSLHSSVLCEVLLRKCNFLSSVLLRHLSLFSPTAHSLWPSLVKSQYPGSMIESFRPLDSANLCLLLARSLVHDGVRSEMKGSVPHDSQHNVFLFTFCLTGDGEGLTGLQVASSMFIYASRGLDELAREQDEELPRQWESFVSHSCREKLQDVVLFALELFCEVMHRRPEVQTHLSHSCSDVFPWVSSHLKPERRRLHLGTAECAARFIACACWRHEACQTLVLESGCVDGLMTALAACADEINTSTHHVLSKCIVEAIEFMVVRNETAWRYVEACSGIQGLLQLCRLGSAKIKNLSCATLMDAAADDVHHQGYADAVVNAAGGVATISQLLNSELEDETTTIIALRLINTMLKVSPPFRLEAYYSPLLSAPLLRLLCRSRASAVRSLICAALATLGADKPQLVRRILQGNRPAMEVLLAMSAAPGDPALSKAATTALACMTASDDSEYPTGAPYLRSALHEAGYLPTLK